MLFKNIETNKNLSALLFLMVLKPVLIPLSDIHPTEYLIPSDRIQEIKLHYDGTVESIKPIKVVGKPGRYLPEDGNKRCLFLYQQGQTHVLAHVTPPEDNPGEFEEYDSLAENAEMHGVRTLDDLAKRIVERKEFEEKIGRFGF